MKWILGLAIGMMVGTCAWAQMDAAATATGAAPIQITDTEATGILQTINGYMQGPMHRGRLEIFDRKKGELVSLRLDKIVTDDPARIVFPQEGQVAVCGECTLMATVISEKGEKSEAESSDKYEVWFVVQRGGIATSRVLDTFVKSVNGNPMYKWTQDDTGKWAATLVPDAEPVPAAE